MKIIVIDDEPIIADTLVNILNGEGHQAIATSSGSCALEWATRFRPDLIVSDVVMPGLSGIDTAKAILKSFPDCRIILFSGQAASTDLLAGTRDEGYSFEMLAKPVDPDVLLDTINSRHSMTPNRNLQS
jgi:CheY-like chemotaxis protein